MKNILEKTKNAIVLIAGVGIATIVRSAISHNTPAPTGKINKIVLWIGTAALSATLIHIVNQRANEMIEEVLENAQDLKKEIDNAKA